MFMFPVKVFLVYMWPFIVKLKTIDSDIGPSGTLPILHRADTAQLTELTSAGRLRVCWMSAFVRLPDKNWINIEQFWTRNIRIIYRWLLVSSNNLGAFELANYDTTKRWVFATRQLARTCCFFRAGEVKHKIYHYFLYVLYTLLERVIYTKLCFVALKMS